MISEAYRRLKHRRRQARAIAEITARPIGEGAGHGLAAPLIVSLTSYPARFGTLALTLKAILRQSIRADRVILWLDEGDKDSLPAEVTALEPEGLEIATCPAWRSYKKIIPTLLAWPEANIVTADDDVYYPRDWLAGLVRAMPGGARVICHRAHRISLNADQTPRPYGEWQHNIAEPEQSARVFLTGVMGVIYTPGAFHEEITRDDLFTRLSPGSDDVWLYWMHRLAGVEAQKIGGRARILEWGGSQAQSLRTENVAGSGNDRAIQAMLDRYGWPG